MFKKLAVWTIIWVSSIWMIWQAYSQTNTVSWHSNSTTWSHNSSWISSSTYWSNDLMMKSLIVDIYKKLENENWESHREDSHWNAEEYTMVNSYFKWIIVENWKIVKSNVEVPYKAYWYDWSDNYVVTTHAQKILEVVNKIWDLPEKERITTLQTILNSIHYDYTEPYAHLIEKYWILEKWTDLEKLYRMYIDDEINFEKLPYETRKPVYDVSTSKSFLIFDDKIISSKTWFNIWWRFETASGNNVEKEVPFWWIYSIGFLGNFIDNWIERIITSTRFIDSYWNIQTKEPQTYILYIWDKKDLWRINELAKSEAEWFQKLRESWYTNSEIIEFEMYKNPSKFISENKNKELKDFYLKYNKELNEYNSKNNLWKETGSTATVEVTKKDNKEESIKETIVETKEQDKNEDVKMVTYEKDWWKYKIDTSKLSCNKVQYVLNNYSTNYFRDTKDIIVATFRDAKVVNWVDWVNFEPNRWITRAEFLSILMKALCEQPEYKNHPFTDVVKWHWTEKVIWQSYWLNWISWYWNNIVKPNWNISKLEVLYVLHRLSKIEVLEFPDNFKLLNLDEKMRNDITKKSVYLWLIRDENVNLNSPIKRDEMLHILKKLFWVMNWN